MQGLFLFLDGNRMCCNAHFFFKKKERVGQSHKQASQMEKTQADLDLELKNEHKAEFELKDTFQRKHVNEMMESIESKRKEKMKHDGGKSTQAYIAHKAGIPLSTYKRYIKGDLSSIKVKTLRSILEALDYKSFDILHPFDD